uniref:Uncharacterized protein n=1 Tax=Pseudomonas phage Touem01 TaxID=3138548 RepID=A0AAU6W2I7_9VIRU
MDLTTALHVMQHSVTEDQRRPMKLVVVVHSPGLIGGTPCVEIEHIAAGFDWDSGKLMFTPATPLTKLSPEDVEAIRESVAKGQSWHAYEAHKAMCAKLKAAECQRDELLVALEDLLPCVGWVNEPDENMRAQDRLGNVHAAPILKARAAIAKAKGGAA